MNRLPICRWMLLVLLFGGTLCGCIPQPEAPPAKPVREPTVEQVPPPAKPVFVQPPIDPSPPEKKENNPPAPAEKKSPETSSLPPSTVETVPTKMPVGPAVAPATPAAIVEPLKTTPPSPAGPAYLVGVPLIPRAVLFGNPSRAAVRISPDGRWVSFLAPVDGVLNVWIAPSDNPRAALPVTQDKRRGIASYGWAYTNKHLLYLQDAEADGTWHVYAVNIETRNVLDLTPLPRIAAQIESVSPRLPGEILIGLNARDPQVHDIYRVDLQTGKRVLLTENTGNFRTFTFDDDYRLRFAARMEPGGNNVMYKPDGKNGWQELLRVSQQDALTTSPVGLDKSGDLLYLIDSRSRNTSALTSLDLKTGQQKLLAENSQVDAGDVLIHPTEGTVEAISFTHLRKKWQVLEPRIAGDLEYLSKVADGEIEITSRTLDDSRWTVAFLMDNGPIRFYLYDRNQKSAQFLFTNRAELEDLPLVKMHPAVIKSRDGQELVCYLSLPPGTDEDGDARPSEPLPMVLSIHDGPWARDEWNCDPLHQWLANRGYAVLSVNYRGSTGFGKQFTNAGNREWGGKMHLDLLDAVQWAIDQRIADPQRIASWGASYGGYATLIGMTLTPETFACGVDLAGPSNLLTWVTMIWQDLPPDQVFKDRVGDQTSPEGRKSLTERSPLSYVDRIRRPLLIGQGSHDQGVKPAESDQIVKAMQGKRIPVTYLLFSEEGHGLYRPENSKSFQAVAEAFLSKHLGGRYEPIGDSLVGSTMHVSAGSEQVPGLAESLKRTPPGQLPLP
jgi:dipeptidyl aminopeptidase/acylaminoacyl peptidase